MVFPNPADLGRHSRTRDSDRRDADTFARDLEKVRDPEMLARAIVTQARRLYWKNKRMAFNVDITTSQFADWAVASGIVGDNPSEVDLRAIRERVRSTTKRLVQSELAENTQLPNFTPWSSGDRFRINVLITTQQAK